MQTWIRANIGKLISRMTAAETAVHSLDDRMDFITAAANHNAIFGGRNLTNVYTIDEMYEMIHSGDFDGLYVGDYFTVSITTDIYTHFVGETFESGVTYFEMSGTINNRVWSETEDTTPQEGKTYATKLTKSENVDLMFAAFDYYYNLGDTALTTHHAVLIPTTAFSTTAKMNPTNTSASGYYNSDMHQITLPCYAKSIKAALNNHLLSHKTWLSNTLSSAAWYETELQLINEIQLYGSMILSSGQYSVGIDNKILPVFNFITNVQYSRNGAWLRSIINSSNFARYGSDGNPGSFGASNALNIRPLIIFG